jgi:hypothetical protein
MKKQILISSAVVLSLSLFAARGVLAEDLPQRDDPDFNPPIENPAYSEGEGPLVVIDEAHHNLHTITGRYRTFAELLERDGYVVESSEGIYTKFTEDALRDIDILVVVNALNEENVDNWKLPTPSAFEDDEIEAVKNWVMKGGSLMLVADHWPFPGAAEKLASAFGFSLSNAYTIRANSPGPSDPEHNMIKFQFSDGSLKPSPIFKGREGFDEAVDLVVSFTGEAFWIQPHFQAKPLLSLPEGTFAFLPSTLAYGLPPTTPTIQTFGLLQGATLQFDMGKVAMFGEASMFSAQLSATPPASWKMGMNNPDAPQNVQFALNVLHWLSGLLPESPPDCIELGLSQSTTIDQDFNVHIPCATYHGQNIDLKMTIDLKHTPDKKEFYRFEADYTIIE